MTMIHLFYLNFRYFSTRLFFAPGKIPLLFSKPPNLFYHGLEYLEIVGRRMDCNASKTSADPSNITWSYTYNRKLAEPDRIIDGVKFPEKNRICSEGLVG
jgi:hypothetical protein